MKKYLLTEVGHTRNGQIVVAGVYAFYETHGLPLDVIIENLQARNSLVDWKDFWISATTAGVKPRRLSMMIEMACSDVLGAEYAQAVMQKLNAGIV